MAMGKRAIFRKEKAQSFLRLAAEDKGRRTVLEDKDFFADGTQGRLLYQLSTALTRGEMGLWGICLVSFFGCVAIR